MDSNPKKNINNALKIKYPEKKLKMPLKPLINGLEITLDREGLKETPKRVIKAYEEFFSGYKESQKIIYQKHSKMFKVMKTL